MPSSISYIDTSKYSLIPFDKISKIIPDCECKRLYQLEDIEQCLNKRNTVYLRHTQGTTCNMESIKALLGGNSFTKFGDELLKGSTNFEGIELSILQKVYFNEKKTKFGLL